MFKFVLIFLLFLPISGWSSEDECRQALGAYSGVIPVEMAGFWSTLDAREQKSVADTMGRFWNHALHHSRLSPDSNFSVFAGLVEHMLTGSFQKRPIGWDSNWLIIFLRELEAQPNTDPAIKPALRKLQELVATHE